MRTKGFIIILIAVASFTLGCRKNNCIVGNHNYVTDARTLSSFHGISSEGAFEINVILDTLNKVEVEAEENLIPYIYTKIHGSTLVIKVRDDRCIREHKPIVISVKTQNLNNIKLLGSGDIYCDSITANNVDISLAGSGEIYAGIWGDYAEVDISGSGKTTLWGEISEGDFKISGSGDIRSYDLEQDTCFATISGSGSMYVYVKDYLDAKITGSGTVHYKGNPITHTHITGSGSVVHQ
ncbi:MAG: DUF2807 domain-containing protein [Saprospiraceae bacterium]|nr:DUF2807 domain-containing protein [Saprospiraceae bacterium]